MVSGQNGVIGHNAQSLVMEAFRTDLERVYHQSIMARGVKVIAVTQEAAIVTSVLVSQSLA